MLILIVVVILGAIVWAFVSAPARKRHRTARAGTNVATLRHRYAALLAMPPKSAEEIIDRQLGELAVERPGASERARLELLISRLERARR